MSFIEIAVQVLISLFVIALTWRALSRRRGAKHEQLWDKVKNSSDYNGGYSDEIQLDLSNQGGLIKFMRLLALLDYPGAKTVYEGMCLKLDLGGTVSTRAEFPATAAEALGADIQDWLKRYSTSDRAGRIVMVNRLELKLGGA